ncbi:unnamed protein product [Cuscuta campestris]|uniref:Reverse transcriptase zinc-binding domain-containing protein n=1 Tax=Cuscuta campestris TaxID=132261 RepID=A0A484MMH8_9ASTE|nr:unnamed protein product [Cuscuta campestris]
MEEARVVKQCLEEYELASGQQVNFYKSTVCFSLNTAHEVKEEISRFFGVTLADDFGKYLGLPSCIGRNKNLVFSFILDKIRRRTCGWNKRLLSKAGKEILLKTVAQAMPQFAMSVFLLPIGVCQKIERIMNQFWWQNSGNASSNIHWLSWRRLTTPKKFGGLGFKDIHAFNIAMLGKQGWRLLTNPDSLAAKIFRARYFPKTSFLEAKIGPNPSFVWRSMLEAQSLIKDAGRKRIGNGSETLVWSHAWLWDESSPSISTPRPEFCPDFPVSFLIDHSTNTWNLDMLQHWFSEEDRARILQVPISPTLTDQWYWALDPSGDYSVKSAYRKLIGEASDTSSFNHWCRLWKLKVAPKIKVCFWRALRDILPVACSLERKGLELDTLCRSCGTAEESVTHVFVACPVAQRLWRVLGVKVVNNHGYCFDSLLHWADFNFRSRTGREMDCVAAGIWGLWKARNMANWESKLPTVGIIEAWTREALGSAPSNCSGPKEPATEPRISGITCSVDAAVFENARRVGVGAILRGEDKSFIGAFNSCINCPLEPRVAETMAIKEALSWIKGHGFSEVSILSDCALLIKALNNPSSRNTSYLGAIEGDCRGLASSFISLKFFYIPRTLNCIAHAFAREAGARTNEWWNSPPTLFLI